MMCAVVLREFQI